MTANMKELNRLAEGDLEMQQLLLNAANNFVEERKKIVDAGSSLHAQAKTKKRKLSGGGAAAADAAGGSAEHGPDYEPPPTIAENAPPSEEGFEGLQGLGAKVVAPVALHSGAHQVQNVEGDD